LNPFISESACLSRASQPNPKAMRSFAQTLRSCYYRRMFRFGRPQTAGQWLAHVVLAIVALFLIWWMFRAFVL
jgi:hypothetical protein